MADNVKEVHCNQLGSYLQSQPNNANKPQAPKTYENDPRASMYLHNGEYIPVSNLIYLYKQDGVIPQIPLSEYSLGDFKEMRNAGIEMNIPYDGEVYTLDAFIRLWEGESEFQKHQNEEAIEKGNLFQMDWGNKEG